LLRRLTRSCVCVGEGAAYSGTDSEGEGEEERDEEEADDDGPPACTSQCAGIEDISDTTDPLTTCEFVREANASGCLAGCVNTPDWAEVEELMNVCAGVSSASRPLSPL
jgi:hypothetical protein